MAKIVAKNTSLYVDNSSAASTAISGRTNTVSLSFSAETPDVTSFAGAGWRERIQDGLKDWELSIGGFYDPAATQIDTILFGILGASTRVQYGPGGSISGCTKYTASAVCSDYTVDGSVEGAATYSATFAARTGAMSASTW